MDSIRFDDDIWLVERITQGSEYDLHLAFWPQENQRILIKSLKPMEDGPKREKIESRLLKEAATLEEFWSPYFPKVFDIRRNEEGVLYLILQYFEGVSLRQYLDLNLERGIKLKVVEEINRELTHALSYLHDKKKVIHFDLSPENIIISPDNKVHLIDFEDAKIIGKEIAQKSIRGKPKYMASELKQSTHSVTASKDFDNYAKKVIYREMLALCSSWDKLTNGLFPFSGSGVLSIFKTKKFLFTALSLLLIASSALFLRGRPVTPKRVASIPPKKIATAKKPRAIKKKRVIKKKAIKKVRRTKKNKVKKMTFKERFSKALIGQDKKLEKCLIAQERKEVTLGFVLQEKTGKLLKLNIRGDLSNNLEAKRCLAKVYGALKYPAHPSQKEVEITQHFKIVTKN